MENIELVIYSRVVQPNEQKQPDLNLTEILTLRANPTQLTSILDPDAQTRPKVGQVQIGIIKYKL